MKEPKVLILDQVASLLDPEDMVEIHGIIDSIIAEGGMTIIVISDTLQTIKLAQNIVKLVSSRTAQAAEIYDEKYDQILASLNTEAVA